MFLYVYDPSRLIYGLRSTYLYYMYPASMVVCGNPWFWSAIQRSSEKSI